MFFLGAQAGLVLRGPDREGARDMNGYDADRRMHAGAKTIYAVPGAS